MITTRLLFVATGLLLASERARGSSYLDDYFLPTAKLALNKIQQTLSSTHEVADMAPLVSDSSIINATTNDTNSNRQNAQPNDKDNEIKPEEPNKSEFIKLDVAPSIPVQPSLGSASEMNERAIVVSSTEASDTDPSSTLLNAMSSGQVSASQVVVTSQEQSSPVTTLGPENSTQISTNKPTITTTEAPNIQTTSEPLRPIESKSADEALKEAEMEAVAAVDATISFGDTLSSLTDSCYDEYGNARFCEPEFENVAFERQVEVSSECGNPPSRFCTAYLNERNDQIRNCHMCDAQHPKKRHPAAYLTDMNNLSSPTCWVSEPISAGSSSNASETIRSDNVTLLLNLDKKYEIIYISVQFCSLKPDSLGIFKSTDFGHNWSPYQFYSSECRQMYGLQSRSSRRTSEPEAGCINSSLSGPSGRIAFSTLEGRSNGISLDRHQWLQDWITATNIKIVLDRHQASWIHSNLVHAHSHPSASKQVARNASEQELESSLISPSDTFNYAVSDLVVGGRCKCNGHASRCIHNKDGRLQCDCRHNTAGRDCEKCAPFHFDRPWARATQLDANPCQPCNCNGHSRKCRFDPELYRLTGKRSGGVCTGCKDNTAGRYCHYCREGFTRDHLKPMTDKEACKHCDCHPIGSLGRFCNQTTGQCPCKEGVTGLQCTRCAAGYQQSSSLSEPCIKLPENDINYEPSLAIDGDGPTDPNSLAGNNEPSIAFSELSGQDQPSSDSFPAHRLAPSGVPKFNKHNKLEPVDDNEAPVESDKDEDADSDDEAAPSRKPVRGQWPNHRKHYYYKLQHSNGRNWPRSHHHPEDQESDLDASPHLLSEEEYQLGGGRGYISQPQYNSYSKYEPDYRPRRPISPTRGRDVLVAPVASLDHDGSANELDELPSSYPMSSVQYNEDNFNQIQTSNNGLRRLHSHGSRVRQPSRARFEPERQTSQVSCGDCQSASRRVNFRKFCHLEYALKATVLNKYMADDWTKFEVEIQDIFKSPSAEAPMLTEKNATPGGGYIDNMVQADEQSGLRHLARANNSVDSEVLEEAAPVVNHRIKVGTLHSIWVPTEDLSCQCPRLKLRSTYLLMGSIDGKENSANSLQLDRHGVALEWKSSLQEKFIKYQRRHSRGRC